MRLPFSSAQPSTGTLLPRPQGLRAATAAQPLRVGREQVPVQAAAAIAYLSRDAAGP